jgi:hypothetical protein
MLQVTFEQYLHAYQDIENKEASYNSYAELLTAIEEYLKPRAGRFNERFIIIKSNMRDTEVSVANADALIETLKQYESDVTSVGHTIMIHLEIHNDPKWGNPILQTITFNCPKACERYISAIQESNLENHGMRYCYCGDGYCAFDCGTMRCGCVGYCECDL